MFSGDSLGVYYFGGFLIHAVDKGKIKKIARWQLEARGEKPFWSISISACSVYTHRLPPYFPGGWGLTGTGHGIIPTACHGGWQKGCKSSVWLAVNYFPLFWYRMRYTHLVIHIGLQMPFYSLKISQACTCISQHRSPFWTQLHVSEKHSATKICNVQTKVSVCTCKYLLWDHPDAPYSFSSWHTIISQVLG